MNQTHRAMNSAPRNTIYVVAGYAEAFELAAKDIARSLGRGDLKIHTSAIFDDDGMRLRGLRVPIVLDPELMLCETHRAVYQRHLAETGPRHQSEWNGIGGTM